MVVECVWPQPNMHSKTLWRCWHFTMLHSKSKHIVWHWWGFGIRLEPDLRGDDELRLSKLYVCCRNKAGIKVFYSVETLSYMFLSVKVQISNHYDDRTVKKSNYNLRVHMTTPDILILLMLIYNCSNRWSKIIKKILEFHELAFWDTFE